MGDRRFDVSRDYVTPVRSSFCFRWQFYFMEMNTRIQVSIR